MVRQQVAGRRGGRRRTFRPKIENPCLTIKRLFAGLLYRAYRESHPLFLAHLVFAIPLQCISYVLALVLVKGPSLLNDAVHAMHIPVLGVLTGILAAFLSD